MGLVCCVVSLDRVDTRDCEVVESGVVVCLRFGSRCAPLTRPARAQNKRALDDYVFRRPQARERSPRRGRQFLEEQVRKLQLEGGLLARGRQLSLASASNCSIATANNTHAHT